MYYIKKGKNKNQQPWNKKHGQGGVQPYGQQNSGQKQKPNQNLVPQNEQPAVNPVPEVIPPQNQTNRTPGTIRPQNQQPQPNVPNTPTGQKIQEGIQDKVEGGKKTEPTV